MGILTLCKSLFKKRDVEKRIHMLLCGNDFEIFDSLFNAENRNADCPSKRLSRPYFNLSVFY